MQSGTTGINTVRAYSVTKQGRDQDPEGTYIRRWVPELVDVPAESIHEPWKMDEGQERCQCRIGLDYPAPLVDEGKARKEGVSKTYAARRDPEARKNRRRFSRSTAAERARPVVESRPKNPPKHPLPISPVYSRSNQQIGGHLSGLLWATRLEEPLQAERRVMSSNPFRFSFLLLLLCVVVFLGTASATSVFLDNPKYDVKTEVGPDAATGGWFIHLGLTGLRVKLTPESPQELEVAYIFRILQRQGNWRRGIVLSVLASDPSASRIPLAMESASSVMRDR